MSTETETTPALQRAQAALLAKVTSEGLLHSLTNSDSLFRMAATAFIADEIATLTDALPPTLTVQEKHQAKAAAALVVCLPYVRQASTNLSTSQGQNLLRLALAESAACALRESPYLKKATDDAMATLAGFRKGSATPLA